MSSLWKSTKVTLITFVWAFLFCSIFLRKEEWGFKKITSTQLGYKTQPFILKQSPLRQTFNLNIIRALELIIRGFTEPFKTLSYSLTPWVWCGGWGCEGGGGKWRPLGAGRPTCSGRALKPLRVNRDNVLVGVIKSASLTRGVFIFGGGGVSTCYPFLWGWCSGILWGSVTKSINRNTL